MSTKILVIGVLALALILAVVSAAELIKNSGSTGPMKMAASPADCHEYTDEDGKSICTGGCGYGTCQMGHTGNCVCKFTG